MANTKVAGTVLLVLSLFACNENESFIATPAQPEEVVIAYEGVDEELWEYFSRFEEEARLRGLETDLRAAGITGVIEELEEDNVAGQCSYASHQPNHVTIDLGFWKEANSLAREFVVFHELGHCRLNRDHREGTNPDGTCLSLMRSGLQTCRDNFTRVTRDSYLDELYDPAFFNTIP